ncbi:MAG: biotin/lipoyl-binding protein, partial [bacterium]|nr:biotin/lipoyl-binding protein [bacterium]
MKRIVWIIIIVSLLGGGAYFIYGKKNTTSNIQTDTVKRLNLAQTVLATGQVVSSTDLGLSFQAGGVVKYLKVKEGDQVKAGQTLAVLDQDSLLASLTSARGALA